MQIFYTYKYTYLTQFLYTYYIYSCYLKTACVLGVSPTLTAQGIISALSYNLTNFIHLLKWAKRLVFGVNP